MKIVISPSKCFSIFLCLFLFIPIAEAVTKTGIINADETWSGIIETTGNVTIAEGVTVTIDPDLNKWNNIQSGSTTTFSKPPSVDKKSARKTKRLLKLPKQDHSPQPNNKWRTFGLHFSTGPVIIRMGVFSIWVVLSNRDADHQPYRECYRS